MAYYNWRTGCFANRTYWTSKHTVQAKRNNPTVTFYAYNRNRRQTNNYMIIEVCNTARRYAAFDSCVYWGKKINSNQGWIS